ncbi:hypothetical protein F6X38_18355 [Aureimonas leprariae]|uniref:Non-reducing end beta-L-arabinofuranosidase-like GH127 C-terminal domain-containing protein n=1 Tax=Plantimonas leprariae TaxID=2615207 RepID=A0A7V7PLP4_9HYPH|nr:hypothetical protein F6X38_18355 [Aureimonas leprariae]
MAELGGAAALVTEGRRETAASGALYSAAEPEREDATIRAVPYYAWDNRANGEMLVWIREEASR